VVWMCVGSLCEWAHLVCVHVNVCAYVQKVV
jgi:hypothetical protein